MHACQSVRDRNSSSSPARAPAIRRASSSSMSPSLFLSCVGQGPLTIFALCRKPRKTPRKPSNVAKYFLFQHTCSSPWGMIPEYQTRKRWNHANGWARMYLNGIRYCQSTRLLSTLMSTFYLCPQVKILTRKHFTRDQFFLKILSQSLFLCHDWHDCIPRKILS